MVFVQLFSSRLPWDEDDEDEDDWVDQHLENRFTIYRNYIENRFGIISGVFQWKKPIFRSILLTS